ncbi:glycosyltransferase [Lactiplantibacillus plantarum]|uniref:glycosyltransferase n=1 Tax=Lactiplantibacillus plantarum TaxID=1590 RepID=UPI0020173002|nr:glycosyltransferase [Lactiplantibacillus plantarum]UQN23990.1 glycosyltransferase [Lactiplantibacillus plantarum]
MKVIFLRDNDIIADSRVLKEASSLVKVGHNVSIVGWDEHRDASNVDGETSYARVSLPIHFLKAKLSYHHKAFKVWSYVKFETALFFYLLKVCKRIDAIHACNLQTGVIGLLAAKLTHKKLVYDIFDFAADTRNYPAGLSQFIHYLEFYVINRADTTIICSEERREQIKGTHPKHLCVIYNSPDLPVNYDPEGQQPKYTIAYVGGLSPYRFLPELVNVVAMEPMWSMTIAGFGKYESMITDYASQDEGILFLGKVPYSKVAKIESNAEILVALYDPIIKNHRFASPNKFFEAFRLGKPLIMIKGTGMSSWLTKLSVGAVVEPSKAGIQAGIKKVMANKSSWTHDGEIMKRTYTAEFSWEQMTHRLQRIYQTLSSQN